MDDLEMLNTGLMMVGLPPQVDYKDAFFQDLKDSIEPVVRNSLFMYLAYLGKGEEAARYREDPKAEIPLIKEEAKLRGMPVPDLVTLIEGRGKALKDAISKLELLRVDFNLRYAKISDQQERLTLRDEFIPKMKALTTGLD